MLTARSTSWLLLTRSQQDRQRACSTMYPPSLGTGSPSGIIPNPGGGMLLIGSYNSNFSVQERTELLLSSADWKEPTGALGKSCMYHIRERHNVTGTVTILHFCGEHIRVQTKCPMFGRGNQLLPTQESLPIWHKTTLFHIADTHFVAITGPDPAGNTTLKFSWTSVRGWSKIRKYSSIKLEMKRRKKE